MVLPVLFFVPTCLFASDRKISSSNAFEIIQFTLFNYDNLIADSYEKANDYIEHLTYLLSKNTGYPTANFVHFLNSREMKEQPRPVSYLVILNKKTKELSRHYFLDD